jgi:fumarate reductase flavoprotein subunit
MERDFDVIVVGAGGAGLSAAVTAARRGARVLIVDSDRQVGGSSRLATGVLYAAGTSVQRSKGINDDPGAMFHYCMALNAYNAQPSLIRTLCDRSADAVEWLISLGVEFRPEDLYVAGVDTVARGHRAANNGAEIIQALDQAASLAGVTISLNTRVRKLLTEVGGGVSGINVDGENVRSGAVVLSTGGFGSNSEMLARYYPEASACESLWYIGTTHARGDGLTLGQSVGADLTGFDQGLLEISPQMVKELDSYLPGWLIYVNRDGRRFIRETGAYAVMSNMVLKQVGKEAFVIFDEAARAAAKIIVTYKPLAPSWTADRLGEFIKEGKITQGNTIQELAENAGIRASTLATTIENYNTDCEAGADSTFFKDPSYLKPIRTPPFYARRIRPGLISLTGTGLRIDHHARVLSEDDRPIGGLFGAGETTSVLPGRYMAGGASLTNNTVFGRIAGEGAARHSMSNRST